MASPQPDAELALLWPGGKDQFNASDRGYRHPQLPQRFYVQNAQPGAADSVDARQILEARFVIAQMLAVEGESDEALAELRTEIYPRS